MFMLFDLTSVANIVVLYNIICLVNEYEKSLALSAKLFHWNGAMWIRTCQWMDLPV